MDIIEITPNMLYQSSRIESTGDYQRILDNGVKAIVDIEGSINPIDAKIEKYLYWAFKKGDVPSLKNLDIVASFAISCIKDDSPVIIHGGDGINRISLISAYIYRLMEKKSGQQSIDYIRLKKFDSLNNQDYVSMLKIL